MPDVGVRLLILGGTTEAIDLAAAIAAVQPRLQVTTSLAGRVDAVAERPGRLRIGGFGGVDGLTRYLVEHAIDVLIDATHPFADVISAHAAEACRRVSLPRLMLVRPEWTPEPGDDWHRVPGFADAAAWVGSAATSVFLATGPGQVSAFAHLDAVRFLVRLFETPRAPLPLPSVRVVIARPPFTVAGERALMRKHRIDALVVKQSGGPTVAKLTAARQLGVPVVIMGRPSMPAGDRVETVAEALDWLAAQRFGRKTW